MSDEVEVLESIMIPKKIRYKDIIWIPETKNKQGNIKQNYFIRWLDNTKHVGDVFTLSDFYSEYPKHKKDRHCRKRLDKVISSLIKEGKIKMWVNKDEFKVLKL